MADGLNLYGVVSPENWTVAVIDGQPKEIVNLAGTAQMVRNAPIGQRRALRRLRRLMDDDHYGRLLAELERTK
ncbi:hypothetical protein [Acidipropionibacterium jensenii]|uniref:hypothetical protein n=2 Tax=Acidipropionibacterium jensenii TaxID=1749 RepID=UPI0026471350|nr:hypothetical protein [Acidipropionibacterium jensenii]MDN6556371.1 hypothetical protein [Acidipropionibacterium acidipropionici]MDN5977988.1 hypothetical protein [Acidipropionibacterium jensenii]MDN5996792.1 hypothetical protein [Acidipropionibacterium jensenii]MDN6427411.1 hypothetical protein [Acidipropionibacterium jensenii]MDN6442441.1 hypothetical protein [Acidipropionibacterium jensenii]